MPSFISETLGAHLTFHPTRTSRRFWWMLSTFIRISPGSETACFLMKLLCAKWVWSLLHSKIASNNAVACETAHTDWLDLGFDSIVHSRASKVVASNVSVTILKASSHGTPRAQIFAAAKWMWWAFRLARYLSKCLLFISSLSSHTWFATWA